MNAIQRIELAIRRVASQMPDTGTKRAFVLIADELIGMAHEGNAEDFEMLETYRQDQL